MRSCTDNESAYKRSFIKSKVVDRAADYGREMIGFIMLFLRDMHFWWQRPSDRPVPVNTEATSRTSD